MIYTKLIISSISFVVTVILSLIYLKNRNKNFLIVLMVSCYLTLNYLDPQKQLTTFSVILWIFWITVTLIAIFIELFDKQLFQKKTP